MNLTTLSITQAAALIKSRDVSPVELVEAHLTAIVERDGDLHSYITVTAELARQQAAQAEREIMAGNYHGVLHGIPLAHKDCFESAGIRTTGGTILMDNYVPTHNAAALQKLEAAGAVLLGKLNLHELMMSITTNNPFYGRAVNPHDATRIPGGSSGGSAVAVAAGLCMGSLGSDSGGSVRLPAALCGVVGFKPTFGRISRRGVLPMSFSLDHVGVMARTVEDAAVLYHATAGYDAADAFSHPYPDTPFDLHLPYTWQGKRIALATEGFDRAGRRADAEVLAAVKRIAHQLEAQGAIIEEVTLPRMDEASRAVFTMIVTEAAAVYADALRDTPEGFSEETRASLERGRDTLGMVYARTKYLQVEMQRQMAQFFEGYDLLLTPTSPVPAPVHDEPIAAQKARLSLLAYTAPFNLTGNPALSIHCGTTTDGLPIGVQVIGRFGADEEVLQAGIGMERL
jgi:aspartyl-tRNA(Asn)/glutamyl-tRNA(Gln) amidotransferase subunit A